ncbi:MAG: toprim domain-containing protein, partial [Verrucomicrobiota bacterium]
IALHARLTGRDADNATQFREAALELNELFPDATESARLIEAHSNEQPLADADKWYSDTTDEEAVSNAVLDFTLNLKPDVPFLLEEKKLDTSTVESFGLGWCSKGMFSGRIVVPVHNAEGDLVAYAGRGLKENDIQKRGRWLFPKGFKKSQELFNYHRLSEFDFDSVGLVVVEGFWSALRFAEAGIPAVALMGREISHLQCRMISDMTDQVWLMLDRDSAGLNAVPKVAARLAQSVYVRLAPYPDDDDRYQPEAFSAEELRAMFLHA